MGKREIANEIYSPEFKLAVVTEIRKGLSYGDAMQKFMPNHFRSFRILKRWERIYLLEGAEGLMKERRGRKNATKSENPAKLNKQAEEDLIAEIQRLRLENEYLKKLQALALSKMKSENGTKPE